MRLSIVLTGIAVALSGPALAKQSDAAAANVNHVSCKGAPNEVRIIIRGVKESVGLMTADLYRNDSEGFLRAAGRVSQVRFAAHAPVTTFCIAAPEPSAFAVAVYHDKNANKLFDKNPFGLPAEPYGVSNNPAMRLAPPKVEDALFEVAANGVTIEIDLRN